MIQIILEDTKKNFFKKLDEKTGRGKEQIKVAYIESVSQTLITSLMDKDEK